MARATRHLTPEKPQEHDDPRADTEAQAPLDARAQPGSGGPPAALSRAEAGVDADPSASGSELEPDATAQPDAEIDPRRRARRDAALAHVRQFGDPVLRTRAVAVTRFDGRLDDEIERMGTLMNDAMGIGLAATQVGVLHRLLVYRVQAESSVVALVNPELEWAGREQEEAEEGCLSLPGVHVEVGRPLRVRVRARDGAGARVLVEASGLEARVIQHEMDHLDGVLILDHVARSVRKEAMRALREAQASSAAA